MTHIHRYADVRQPDPLDHVERPAHVGQDVGVARFVQLVFQAEANLRAVLRALTDALLHPTPLLQIIHLEAVVVAVDQRAAGDHVRAELDRQIHRHAHLLHGLPADLRIGVGEGAALPAFLLLDVQVDSGDRQPALFDDADRLLHVLELGRIHDLDPVGVGDLLGQFQPADQVAALWYSWNRSATRPIMPTISACLIAMP